MLLLSITVCSVFATTTNKKEELIQKKQGRVPHGRHDFRNGLETDVLDRGSIEKIRGKLPQKNLSVGDTYEEYNRHLNETTTGPLQFWKEGGASLPAEKGQKKSAHMPRKSVLSFKRLFFKGDGEVIGDAPWSSKSKGDENEDREMYDDINYNTAPWDEDSRGHEEKKKKSTKVTKPVTRKTEKSRPPTNKFKKTKAPTKKTEKMKPPTKHTTTTINTTMSTTTKIEATTPMATEIETTTTTTTRKTTKKRPKSKLKPRPKPKPTKKTRPRARLLLTNEKAPWKYTWVKDSVISVTGSFSLEVFLKKLSQNFTCCRCQ
ncbi:hypothetical protein Y032_0279g1192 [Ancylostoma ceylanicum]|uniref:Uncharacterized protein n=1 Tax=Ancylostoma ceylanicum TaxID=53326 RepID=A0A016S7H0_9BILA|nr:hypothetical protein Y032_0279g1192 [Ancylostoma ceylanicum]